MAAATTKIMTRLWMIAVFAVIMVVVNLRGTWGEMVLGEENEDFDFDGLPGAQHEFKVEIAAGTEDCFYLKVDPKATFHVSFEVLRGGDRSVGMFVRNSQGHVINGHQYKSDGIIEFETTYEDTYSVCVDNTQGGFSSKLVFVYIVVFAVDNWSAYSKEMDDFLYFTENATRSLSIVEQSVQNMWTSQSRVRLHAARDMYLVMANHRYVQNWSIVQCIVIIVASVIQVVFVRRLFRTTNVTPSCKPRA